MALVIICHTIFYRLSCRVYIWRNPTVASTHNVCCQLVKHSGGSVMIRATISRQRLDPKIAVHALKTPKEYSKFYRTRYTLLCKHRFHIAFPYSTILIPIYSQARSRERQDWVKYLAFQSPDLNISELLKKVLERKAEYSLHPSKIYLFSLINDSISHRIVQYIWFL